MKFKDDFTSVTVVGVLFVSKQAANSTYFYATAKVIVKLSNNGTHELQFRLINLLLQLLYIAPSVVCSTMDNNNNNNNYSTHLCVCVESFQVYKTKRTFR